MIFDFWSKMQGSNIYFWCWCCCCRHEFQSPLSPWWDLNRFVFYLCFQWGRNRLAIRKEESLRVHSLEKRNKILALKVPECSLLRYSINNIFNFIANTECKEFSPGGRDLPISWETLRGKKKTENTKWKEIS